MGRNRGEWKGREWVENEGRAFRDEGGNALGADVYCIYKDRMTHFVSNERSALLA